MTFRTILGAAVAGLVILVAAALTSGTAVAYSRMEIKQIVVEEALNSRVPPSLALALAKVESDYQANALSKAGARGVMQIMPKTGSGEFGVGPEELWQPRLNIQLGIDYLERLIDRYDGSWELALSHYNGGSLDGVGSGVRPHSYTRKYVDAVLRWQRRYAEQAAVWKIAEMAEPDSWTAARTRVPRRERRIVVRDIPPDTGPATTAQAGRWRTIGHLEDRDLDDFTASIESRRIRARRWLDDFAPVVTWTEG